MRVASRVWGFSLSCYLVLCVSIGRAETKPPAPQPQNEACPTLLSVAETTPIKHIVIEGAGDVTERFYISALAAAKKNHPGLEVTFCDFSQANEPKEAAEKRARIRGRIEAEGFDYIDKSNPEGHAKYAALEADSVVFAVPGRFHKSLTEYWLNKRHPPRYALLEKPVADSIEGANELLDLLPYHDPRVLAIDHYRPKLDRDEAKLKTDLAFLGGQITRFKFVMIEDRSGSDPTSALMSPSARDGAIERENRVSVMSQGVAADLLPHMLAILQYYGQSSTLRPLDVWGGRYLGVDGNPDKETEIPRETFFAADFAFEDFNRHEVMGEVVVGKGLRTKSRPEFEHEAKYLELTGINGRRIFFDLRSHGKGAATASFLNRDGTAAQAPEAIEPNPYHAFFEAVASDQVAASKYTVSIEEAVIFRERTGKFTRGLKTTELIPLYPGGMGGVNPRPAPFYEDLLVSLPNVSGPRKASNDGDIAMIGGFGVMGAGFTERLSKDNKVIVSDPNPRADDVMKKFSHPENVRRAVNLKQTVAMLKVPRTVMLLVPNDRVAEGVLSDLKKLLSPGDLVIDAGNTHWKKTLARQQEFATSGIDFVGMGVSGGEKGAWQGSSMMAGGDPKAWARIAPKLEAIASRIPSLDKPGTSEPSVALVGPSGSGHFVKIAHNGIEYAEMALVADAFNLLHEYAKLDVNEIANIFAAWDTTELNTFLLTTAVRVLSQREPGGQLATVDMIRRQVENKGTGRWASENALELGVDAPALFNAMAQRFASMGVERAAHFEKLEGPKHVVPTRSQVQELVDDLRRAMYAARLLIYDEQFRVIQNASAQYFNNEISPAATLNVWRTGSILQGALLDRVQRIYAADPDLPRLAQDRGVQEDLNARQMGLREVVELSARTGVSAGAFSAALNYYDAYRTLGRNPTNLLAGIRDAFGAHTFERTDRPAGDKTHLQWDGTN